MNITITPSTLTGTVSAPPSKSCAHRILICAALANKPSSITCGPVGKDVQATVDCLRALGAKIESTPDGFWVKPILLPPEKATLPCGESGSTLRFLLPVAGALGVEATFVMDGRLPQRPIQPLWKEMERMGCRLSRPTENTILCKGQLRPGVYRINGRVSSQFISGLLMAMLLLDKSRLEIEGKIESWPYIELTMDILKKQPDTVEGDWSNAAFWLAANALGSQIQVTDLKNDSHQGDKAILQLLPQLEEKTCISAADIPDLIPVLAVVAAAKNGAVFTDIGRLRLKESDRVAAILEMLAALGGRAEADDRSLTVYPARLTGGKVDARNDHRIAMAAAVAASVCTEPVTILGAECVHKSYPQFWEDYQQLGGQLCTATSAKA